MIYLSIKEASKYIKRETGIKFSAYELAKLSTSGYFRLFLDNYELIRKGYKLRLTSLALQDEIIKKAGRDRADFLIDSFGKSIGMGGYTEILSPCFYTPEAGENCVVSEYRILADMLVSTPVTLELLSYLLTVSKEPSTLAEEAMIENNDIGALNLGSYISNAIYARENIEQLFERYFKHKALLLSFSEVVDKCGGIIDTFNIDELFFNLDDVKHFSKHLKSEKAQKWNPIFQVLSPPGGTLKDRKAKHTPLLWVKIDSLFRRRAIHVAAILEKLEHIADEKDGIVTLDDIKNLSWRGGLESKAVRALNETFIPKVRKNIEDLGPD